MSNYIVKLVEQNGVQARETVDRIFLKALKADVFKGDVLGYCVRCDEWHNQTRNRSPFCPDCRALLGQLKYVQKTIKFQ